MSRTEIYEELYRLGLSDSEIGRRAGVTRSAIYLWRKKNGLASNVAYAPIEESNARELYDAGCNDSEIARQVGVHRNSVWSWRGRHGLPPLTPHDRRPQEQWEPLRKKILTNRKRGLTYSEIAARLGVTRSVVAGVIHRNS